MAEDLSLERFAFGGPPINDLSPDQSEAVALFKTGANLCVSGPGGTGKTFLIQKMKTWGAANGKRVAVCAMTGTAAQLIDGITVHRWAGIGLGTPESFVRAGRNRTVAARWRETDVLILDEVSMLEATLFEELDSLGKRIKRNLAPFGGTQLVFCGDFCQLPPIGNEARFCFESERWASVFPTTVRLTTMHRQKDHLEFASVLNEIREGRVTAPSKLLLESRLNLTPPPDATRIVPTRHKADTINRCEYAELDPSTERVFAAKYFLPSFPSPESLAELEKLKERLVCTLRLKVGTVVMATFNVDENVCNGSQGVVVAFASNGFPVVRFNKGFCRTMNEICLGSEGYPGVSVRQVPLMYAWAITIHKSQGISLDVAEIDIGGDVFEDGQAYVALSRLRSLEGLFLSSFDPSRIRMSSKAKLFYSN
jgi:ATP-dependent DNA helicase PIF1